MLVRQTHIEAETIYPQHRMTDDSVGRRGSPGTLLASAGAARELRLETEVLFVQCQA